MYYYLYWPRKYFAVLEAEINSPQSLFRVLITSYLAASVDLKIYWNALPELLGIIIKWFFEGVSNSSSVEVVWFSKSHLPRNNMSLSSTEFSNSFWRPFLSFFQNFAVYNSSSVHKHLQHMSRMRPWIGNHIKYCTWSENLWEYYFPICMPSDTILVSTACNCSN